MIKSFKFTKEKLALVLILVLSAILNFGNLGIEGFGNEYYAAGVKSMLVNFKNFFFLSFDPTGYITMDKTPIGLWIQAIFAKIFGFSGWSIIIPQAIAGVISVGLLYYLVKKYFGFKAGLISGLMLAITPVFVAASRNNTIDNILLLTTLISCIYGLKAAEKGKLRYLIISFIWVAVGFNVKMAEAFLVLPAIYAVYFLSKKNSFKKKIIHLILGSIILGVLSLSWGFIVDMVPATNRPFVGSSTNNNVIELMVGHNGLQRLGVYSKLNGGSFLPKDMVKSQVTESQPKNDSKDASVINSDRGIKRLFTKNSMADQVVWFIPFAILGILASIVKEKNILNFSTERKMAVLFWIAWFIPDFIYFSLSGGIAHTYYLTMIAAPITALAGIGIINMWRLYKENYKSSILLIIGFLLTIFFQGRMLLYYNANLNYYLKIITWGALSASLITILLLFILRRASLKTKKILVIISLVGTLIVPLIASADTLFYPMDGNAAEAGLQLLPDKGQIQKAKNINITNNIPKLISYLEKNESGEKFLLVTPTAINTSPYAEKIILHSDKSVMALGGFSGADNVINLDKFKEMVKNKEIKYVLVEDITLSPNNKQIMDWVQSTGTLVPRKDWQTVEDTTNDVNLYEVGVEKSTQNKVENQKDKTSSNIKEQNHQSENKTEKK